MRQLVLLVCMPAVIFMLASGPLKAGVIPSWGDPADKFGFCPITNEVSFYKNYDDGGEDRGQTLQVISINTFKILTTFNVEFTADFNWRYSYVDPFDMGLGKNRHDYYIELSLVKPVTGIVSINLQRVTSTFEPEPVNQFGFRLSF